MARGRRKSVAEWLKETVAKIPRKRAKRQTVAEWIEEVVKRIPVPPVLDPDDDLMVFWRIRVTAAQDLEAPFAWQLPVTESLRRVLLLFEHYLLEESQVKSAKFWMVHVHTIEYIVYRLDVALDAVERLTRRLAMYRVYSDLCMMHGPTEAKITRSIAGLTRKRAVAVVASRLMRVKLARELVKYYNSPDHEYEDSGWTWDEAEYIVRGVYPDLGTLPCVLHAA